MQHRAEFEDIETAKRRARRRSARWSPSFTQESTCQIASRREDRSALSQHQGLGHDRRSRSRDPSRQGRRGPVERLSVFREVHARHPRPDGEELHRQPLRGSPQGHAREGRAGTLADGRACRLRQQPRDEADRSRSGTRSARREAVRVVRARRRLAEGADRCARSAPA